MMNFRMNYLMYVLLLANGNALKFSIKDCMFV